MEDGQALSQSTWNCNYDVGFISKCPRTALLLEQRKYTGEALHDVAAQKEVKIVEVYPIGALEPN